MKRPICNRTDVLDDVAGNPEHKSAQWLDRTTSASVSDRAGK